MCASDKENRQPEGADIPPSSSAQSKTLPPPAEATLMPGPTTEAQGPTDQQKARPYGFRRSTKEAPAGRYARLVEGETWFGEKRKRPQPPSHDPQPTPAKRPALPGHKTGPNASTLPAAQRRSPRGDKKGPAAPMPPAKRPAPLGGTRRPAAPTPLAWPTRRPAPARRRSEGGPHPQAQPPKGRELSPESAQKSNALRAKIDALVHDRGQLGLELGVLKAGVVERVGQDDHGPPSYQEEMVRVAQVRAKEALVRRQTAYIAELEEDLDRVGREVGGTGERRATRSIARRDRPAGVRLGPGW